MTRSSVFGINMVVVMIAQAACTRDISLLPVVSLTDAGGNADVPEASGAMDLGVPALDTGGARPPDGGGVGASCSGIGAPIQLPTSGGDVCAGALSARAHRFALCACHDLGVISPLRTDAFDSTLAAGGGPVSAAIGVNGRLQAEAPMQVGGAVYVAGAEGLTTSQSLTTTASLRVAGSTRITSSSVQVGTDAYLGMDVSGILLVAGTLHVPMMANTALAIIAAGATVREPVSVPPPCDCAPGFVDVPGAIAATARRNDNLAIGLTTDRLGDVGTSAAVDLPCGHYLLSAIDATQTVFLAVRGRALLAVTGDVLLRGGMTVSLDPGAELDLLVGGKFETSGPSDIGANDPARFRIWVANAEIVTVDDGPRVRAMIHAPRSVVVAPAGLDLSGGLFSSTFLGGAALDLHFDEAVFNSGVNCGEPTAIAVP